MNVMLKRVIEIAGGLVVGSLLNNAVNKAIEVSKKAVEKYKAK